MSSTYNYRELTSTDKVFIDGYDKAVDEITEGCDEYIIDEVCADHEDADSIAGQMKRELVNAAFQIIWRILEDRRQSIIESMIDGYDDE